MWVPCLPYWSCMPAARASCLSRGLCDRARGSVSCACVRSLCLSKAPPCCVVFRIIHSLITLGQLVGWEMVREYLNKCLVDTDVSELMRPHLADWAAAKKEADAAAAKDEL